MNYLIYVINNTSDNYTDDKTIGFCYPDIDILKVTKLEGDQNNNKAYISRCQSRSLRRQEISTHDIDYIE